MRTQSRPIQGRFQRRRLLDVAGAELDVGVADRTRRVRHSEQQHNDQRRGTSGTIPTVNPADPTQNSQTTIARERSGPRSPSTTGTGLNANPPVSGGVGVSPGC
jgi:hypothetical protein